MKKILLSLILIVFASCNDDPSPKVEIAFGDTPLPEFASTAKRYNDQDYRAYIVESLVILYTTSEEYPDGSKWYIMNGFEYWGKIGNKINVSNSYLPIVANKTIHDKIYNAVVVNKKSVVLIFEIVGTPNPINANYRVVKDIQ